MTDFYGKAKWAPPVKGRPTVSQPYTGIFIMDTTGLFFGSFNPIHNGHLAIARHLLDKGYCTRIWFVISPQNPWKKDSALLGEEQRFEIVAAAIQGDPRMEACDAEFAMPRPSYTYQTLQLLSEKYPHRKFALIVGGDNWQQFHLWKNHQDIADRYPILVYPRPDRPEAPCHGTAAIQVEAPLLTVSSTAVRHKLSRGEDISTEVPASALNLIQKYYRI